MITLKKIRSVQYRLWSNDELKYVLDKINNYNNVVNVSGWKDSDKEGGLYRDYFSKAAEYRISNYPDDKEKGVSSSNDIPIDLSQELSHSLINKFDIAFSHTVLEHVPNPEFAFEQICKLSSDLVITIIPWKQVLHFNPGQFGDWFRISPIAMRAWHQKNKLTIIHESWSPDYSPETYLFYVGSKKPLNHSNFNGIRQINELNGLVGKTRFLSDLYGLLLRVMFLIYKKLI
jgi:hypothetical protein